LFENIQDKRVKHEKGYDLYLQIPEEDYFLIYEYVNYEAAFDILHQFLQIYEDDGRPDIIRVKHDKDNHTVNIKAILRYEGNKHTDMKMRPNYLKH
jgi:hypothetical protein